MRRVLFFMLVIILSSHGAPTDEKVENCDKSDEVLIDERQNGTENYRVNVNGLVLMYAPAGSLLAATALLDTANLDAQLQEVDIVKPQNDENKPLLYESTTESDSNDIKPNPTKRHKLKLPSFILPFLRKRNV